MPLFEPDAAVIHEAVLRQSAELKLWQLDPRPGRVQAVQDMLNEVNGAGVLLEDPKTKADYDRRLAEQLGVPLPRLEEPAPREGEAPAEPSDSVADVVSAPEGRTAARPRAAPVPTRTCPECGEPMAAGDKFCGACGFSEAEEREAARRRRARRSRMVTALAVGVPLVAGALLLIGVFSGRGSAPAPTDGSGTRPATVTSASPRPGVSTASAARKEPEIRQAAALKAKRENALAARMSAQDSMQAVERAFKTDARPASFARGKEALANGDRAVGKDENLEAAKKLFDQAKAAFTDALAQADDFNALAKAMGEWAAALAAADADLLGKHAAAEFAAAKQKATEAEAKSAAGQARAATDLYKEAAEALRKAEAIAKLEPLITVDLGRGIRMELVLIRPGTPEMGSDAGGDWEKPVHKVTVGKPFYIGKYEVTQEQWQAVMGANPSSFEGRKNPVDRVSWNACQDFVRKLREKTGRKFSLPSEAEWEYACRAGTRTRYSFGDDEAGLADYAWYLGNSGSSSHPVGQKRPNAWGLHDMHGNVCEWCEDAWHGSYVGAPADGSPWVAGGDQDLRVLRGGSWNDDPSSCPSAIRGRVVRWCEDFYYGCRVVLRIGEPTAVPATPEIPKAVVPAPPPTVPDAARLQADAAKALGVPVEKSIDLGSGTKMGFVFIPAGSFRMGSETEDPSERPVHLVTLSKPFYMGKYEVTQEQWQAVMGANPSRFKGPRNPVESVSWNACQDFVKKLIKKTGRRFSLPSEAEWEYACRAGSKSRYSFGDDAAGLDGYVWYNGNSGGTTHPVGQKKPNAWGLYDMHGSVWEWCEDPWHEGYVGAPADGSPWVRGGAQGLRIVRGGSWNAPPTYCRSAYRGRSDPTDEYFNNDCRVVLRDF